MDEIPTSEIILYPREDGSPALQVRLEGETVWLSQQQMADLFGTSKQNISHHINNILNEGELNHEATVKNCLTVRNEGNRQVTRDIEYYNLDMIISLGYRIKSSIATQFRIWATQRLREYLIKGFTLDDERLKGNVGEDYWKELLERIRDIRSSEKALYRQVLDLYSTSRDYSPGAAESVQFFKIVQNKLHYAASGQTTAEIIHARADSNKDFMGLTTFDGVRPRRQDIAIAKNYLTEDELFVLHRLVSAFFDLAEIRAKEHQSMYMKDWLAELDKFAAMYGKGVLQDAGKVSHQQAEQKAIREYRDYQARTLSPVEHDYLDTIKLLEKQAERKIRKRDK